MVSRSRRSHLNRRRTRAEMVTAASNHTTRIYLPMNRAVPSTVHAAISALWSAIRFLAAVPGIAIEEYMFERACARDAGKSVRDWRRDAAALDREALDEFAGRIEGHRDA